MASFLAIAWVYVFSLLFFSPSQPFSFDINDETGQVCTWEKDSNQLIRVKDSRNLGALYLKSSREIVSTDCEDLCCETESCDLAVFKDDTEKRNCYLFHCGSPSVCLFIYHPSYNASFKTVASLPTKEVTIHVTEQGRETATPTSTFPVKLTSHPDLKVTTQPRATTSLPMATTEAPETTEEPSTAAQATTQPTAAQTTAVSTSAAVQKNRVTPSRNPIQSMRTPSHGKSNPGILNSLHSSDSDTVNLSDSSGGMSASVVVIPIIVLLVCVAAVLVVYKLKMSKRIRGYFSHDDYLINGMYT
eukprot:m.307632 g.307632  ORF g.307632 m.307632 type:complete len:302 (+) comp42555_c0_seq1:110-1015(+)